MTEKEKTGLAVIAGKIDELGLLAARYEVNLQTIKRNPQNGVNNSQICEQVSLVASDRGEGLALELSRLTPAGHQSASE